MQQFDLHVLIRTEIYRIERIDRTKSASIQDWLRRIVGGYSWMVKHNGNNTYDWIVLYKGKRCWSGIDYLHY